MSNVGIGIEKESIYNRPIYRWFATHGTPMVVRKVISGRRSKCSTPSHFKNKIKVKQIVKCCTNFFCSYIYPLDVSAPVIFISHSFRYCRLTSTASKHVYTQVTNLRPQDAAPEHRKCPTVVSIAFSLRTQYPDIVGGYWVWLWFFFQPSIT